MSFRRPFADRERAFEEAFFRKESARLIDAMKEKKERAQEIEALSAALNVDDEKILGALVDLGIHSDNVAALVLAPLIAVAWADKNLDDDERRIILATKADHGIDPDSEGAKLLSSWLDHRPHESLIDVWAAYANDLCHNLEPAERDRLKGEITSRASRIAHSMEKVRLRGHGATDAELGVLAKIEAAFDTSEAGA